MEEDDSSEDELELDPEVCRSSRTVFQQIEELHERVIENGTDDRGAKYLLSSKGIDLRMISQKLDDCCECLPRQLRCNSIEDVIQNELQNCKESVINENDGIYIDGNEPERVKQKIVLMSCLVGPSQKFIDLRNLKQTVLDKVPEKREIHNRIEESYAQAVIGYNGTSNHCQKLFQIFADVAKSFHDEKPNVMWSIVEHLISCSSPMKRHQDPKEFVTLAKSFLENQFKLYMVARVLLEKCESTSNICKLIRRFVKINLQAKDMIGLVNISYGLPLWPLVYYSLRSGEMRTALEFLNWADYDNGDLMQVLQDRIKHPSEKINPRLLAQLYLHYSTNLKNTTDPFQKAAFCIIVGFDLHEPHSQVVKSNEDFLWLQLYIVNIGHSDPLIINEFTLPGLQLVISEDYGERHFHASKQPHIYFQTLMLSGQFEAAIEFLARHEDYRSHAVHMALALHQFGALSTVRDVQSPLLYADDDDPRPMKRLNFSRLIAMYAEDLEFKGMLTEALHYYSFLRKYKYSDGRDVFSTYVCDLAYKTRKFDLIFGVLDPSGNGPNTVGILDQIADLKGTKKSIAAMLAEKLLDHGMFENAVNFFDISRFHDNALKVLSTLLSQCLMDFPEPFSMCHRLARTTRIYMERIEANQIIIRPHIKETIVLLHEFLKFFNLYHNNKFEEALESLENTKLIPTESSEVDNIISNFNFLSPEVFNAFPHVLIGVMDIYCKLYARNKKELALLEYDVTEDDPTYIELCDKADALIVLAGSTPIMVPNIIMHHLLQLRVSMD